MMSELQRLDFGSYPLRGTFAAAAKSVSETRGRKVSKDSVRRSVLSNNPDPDILTAVANEIDKRLDAKIRVDSAIERYADAIG